MKILDRYILSTYTKTFLSVFIIFMFIFVLQALWLYISELAGKELDTLTTIKFIFYSSPKLIPLVVPLSVLLSSIMVFGNFAENYEFAAMKSTGISLQRAMRSLTVFIVLLGIGCFFFSNNVIPWGEYNFHNLRKNIAKVKPALAIAEGQFNEIGNYTIWVHKKSGERGQFLEDVVIYQKKSQRRGNYTTIVSKNGELKSGEDSNILKLELKDGNYYDELITKDIRKFNTNKPHAQSTFETYVINVDLGNLNSIDLDEKTSDNRYNMLDASDLNYTIDSLFKKRDKGYKDLAQNLYNRTTYHTLKTSTIKDTNSVYTDDILDLFNNKKKAQILNQALNTITSTTQIIQSNTKSFENNTKNRNKHIIALHDKYALGFACVILFFVGAPLGALIRKGGIGLPMVIAILLFLSYHFIGLFIKNSAKNGTIDPVFATWLSTFIMLPLSIYLTYRATKDRGLIELDFILVPLKKMFKLKSNSEISNLKSVQSYSYYNKHSVDDLVAVIKAREDYDIDKKPALIALQHLSDRNTSFKEMEAKGLYVPQNLKTAKQQLKHFLDYSTTSLVTFCIGAVLLVLHFVFANNKLPELAVTVKSLSIISFGIFLLYFVVSSLYYSKFYQALNDTKKKRNWIWGILSLPLYPFYYFLSKIKTKEDYHLSYIKLIN